MKYLDLFSGYGGFSLGIQQAYEEHNKNSNDTRKGQKPSEQQGVSIFSNDRGFQREEVFTNGECKNTTQGGIDKFYKQGTKLESINYAELLAPDWYDINDSEEVYQKKLKKYGTIRNYDVSEERGGEEASQGVDEEGEGLHPLSSKTTLPADDRRYELSDSSIDEGQPHCVGFSEIDKYAIQVYKKHFNHKEYGDITKLDPKELPNFDLLCGGFPCQAFSIAGKRAGFEDTRGTLIYDVFRIIKEKHPKLVLLENVKGLLSHDSGRTFKTIITSLAELGYAVEWQVLNAKNFGVPQNRERVFIVGHLGGFSGRQVFPITETNPKALRQVVGGSQGFRVYDPDGIACTQASQAGGLGAKTGLYVSHVDRSKGEYKLKETERAGCLTSTMYKGIDASGRTGVIETRPDYDGCMIRRLTPIECERLMGLPDGWTEYGLYEHSGDGYLEGEKHFEETKISDTQRYKLCGNGVVVNVVKQIIIKLKK